MAGIAGETQEGTDPAHTSPGSCTSTGKRKAVGFTAVSLPTYKTDELSPLEMSVALRDTLKSTALCRIGSFGDFPATTFGLYIKPRTEKTPQHSKAEYSRNTKYSQSIVPGSILGIK